METLKAGGFRSLPDAQIKEHAALQQQQRLHAPVGSKLVSFLRSPLAPAASGAPAGRRLVSGSELRREAWGEVEQETEESTSSIRLVSLSFYL